MNTAVDVNKPVENPELVKLLDEFNTTSSAEQQNKLIEKIAEEFALKSNVLAVVNMDDNAVSQNRDGQTIIKEGTSISFTQLRNAQNQLFFAVYTDWKELRKNSSYRNEDVKTLILSFDDCYALSKDNNAGIVINPFSHNLAFSEDNMNFIKQRKDVAQSGHAEVTVKKDTEVLLGDPSVYPEAMVKAIKTRARKIKEISAIWLKLMIRDREKSYLLVVDFKGDRQQIFSAVAEAAKPFLPSGMYIDMVPYDQDFGRSAATGAPFYKRKKLFSFF